MNDYRSKGINGPVVTVTGGKGRSMQETVRVGNLQLIGEVVGMRGEETTVQVYEETSGLKPGQRVLPEGRPMSVQLGPGLLGNIFDGSARPLKALQDATGEFLGRGCLLYTSRCV